MGMDRPIHCDLTRDILKLGQIHPRLEEKPNGPYTGSPNRNGHDLVQTTRKNHADREPAWLGRKQHNIH